jgi:hypothetical protein
MKTRPIKIIGSAIVAVLLGAIGSGVWSGLLSPLWNSFIMGIVKLITHFSGSLADSIYFEAAKGFHEAYSLSVLTLLMGMLTGVYISFIIIRALFRFGSPKEALTKFMRSKYEFIAFCIFMLVPITMCTFFALYSSYSNKVTTGVLTSIEIAAPFVGANEVLHLKSQFHQIQSRKDYSMFYSHLKALEAKHGIKLTLTEPL